MTDKPEQDNGPEDEQEDTSLQGKGFDILTGGENNPFLADLLADKPASQQENPFANYDKEADDVLMATPVSSAATAEEPEEVPPDAFWDRGRGPEAGRPTSLPESAAEAPPRDLSPEDLGVVLSEVSSDTSSTLGGGAEIPSVPAPPVEYDTLTTPPENEPEVDKAFDVIALADRTPVDTGPLPSSVASMFEPDPADPVMGSDPDKKADPTLLEDSVPVPAVSDTSARTVVRPQSSSLAGTPDDPLISDSSRFKVLLADPALDVPASKALTEMLITDQRVDALWNEIDELYKVVVNDVRGHYETTEQALNDLKRAREYLMAGKEYFDNAEELVMHAKAKLRLEEKVRQWSKTRGSWIVVYLVIWLLIVSASTLIVPRVEGIAVDFGVPEWLAATLLPGLYGAFGGVVGALWVLIKHIVIRRDFDPIHTTWYLTNPLMGTALGVMAYFLVLGGGIVGTFLANSETEATLTYSTAPVMYLLCWVVGFRQNVFWKLIDRFTSTILPGTSDDEDSTSSSLMDGIQ